MVTALWVFLATANNAATPSHFDARADIKVSSKVLATSQVLRGGEKAQTLRSRQRMVVAVGVSSDHSICEMHPTAMELMGIESGGHVVVRGRKQRKITCVAMPDDSLEHGEVRLSSSALVNTGLTTSDVAIVSSTLIQVAGRVLLIPFASSIAGYDGNAFDDALKPFLADNDRPLTVGELFHTPCGDGLDARVIVWKVMEIDIEDAKTDVTETTGVIGKATEIFMDGDPLLDEEMHCGDDKIGYEDIGGMSRQLSTLAELIDLPLKQPQVFETIGVRPPRGVLIHGPAGSGKTMIANAVKTECGVYFKTLNGPEIMSKRSGESEAGLRMAFEEAEENAPAIIFIDEIDAIAPKREKTQGELERRIVSQLLTLMDGIKPTSQVIVLGATNRANIIDPALRRFGRFDREIDLGTPDADGRFEILQIKTKKMRLSAEVDLRQIADDAHGYAGADLGQLVTEAAMLCVREKAGEIDVDAEDIKPELLDMLMVRRSHLEWAMSKTSPSSLRDKSVEMPDVSWNDVGGLLDVKREMTETLMYPLKYADKFARYGMSPSKGMLLYGPSGCGKTLVAKAIANEVKSNFISVKGPELLSMWFGESESNVRQLFDKARGAAPCILFFDEIDSIAKPRGSGSGGGSDSGDRIVNQILTEIDGVGSKKSVFVIAATNRPDMLDSAVMRPGRLDQLVYLPLPDFASRISILRATLRKSPMADEVDLNHYAELMDGFSGADITEVCQRACKLAIRQLIADVEVGLREHECCSSITKAHMDEAMSVARKSVSKAEIKKFERFQASMKAR